MIVIEQAQLSPTVFYLSPWMQSAAFAGVCVPVQDGASLLGPLWQLADVPVTVSECVPVFVGI